jgi:hypothetical protein
MLLYFKGEYLLPFCMCMCRERCIYIYRYTKQAFAINRFFSLLTFFFAIKLLLSITLLGKSIGGTKMLHPHPVLFQKNWILYTAIPWGKRVGKLARLEMIYTQNEDSEKSPWMKTCRKCRFRALCYLNSHQITQGRYGRQYLVNLLLLINCQRVNCRHDLTWPPEGFTAGSELIPNTNACCTSSRFL